MKVLNYLEFRRLICFANEQEEAIQAQVYEYRINQIAGTMVVLDFYSQPFKPELITELFERWNKDLWDVELNKPYQTYFYHNKKIVIRENKYIEYWNETYCEDMHYPRTFDDFINDCQRAGIELEKRIK